MVSIDTPFRSFSSARSRISSGAVSSMNCTNGSMESGYWTRCGIGMVGSPSMRSCFGAADLPSARYSAILAQSRRSSCAIRKVSTPQNAASACIRRGAAMHAFAPLRRYRASDDALFGEPLDLAGAAAEQLGQDPQIVLAVARRAAVDRAADIGRGLAELHRDLVDRPGTDLGAGDLGEPFQVAQLRVGVDAVLGVLAHAGRHPGLLQFHHAVVAVLGLRPGLDRSVERILVLQAGVQRREAAVVEPRALLGRSRQ